MVQLTPQRDDRLRRETRLYIILDEGTCEVPSPKCQVWFFQNPATFDMASGAGGMRPRKLRKATA